MILVHLFLWSGIVSAVIAQQSPRRWAFASRLLEGEQMTSGSTRSRRLETILSKHPNFRRRHGSLATHPSDRRQNKQDFTKEENCDQSLLTCLPEDECANCFRFLYSEDIDWGRITPETSCEETLGFLAEKNYCEDMHDDKASKEAFCKSFNACAVWEEDEPDDSDEDARSLDCAALLQCDWEGMHKSFIGDGICHDGMSGCYNTAICDYDGGDCCEDTCQSKTYVECGHDGYACRNPESASCNPFYTLTCKNDPDIPDENNPDPAVTKCNDDETKYRLVMYDSFGDGWDETAMTITPTKRKSDIRFKGGLERGSSGSRYICLPSASACIHVDVSGGEWGNEISWEIKPLTNGAPALGGGGAPMSCDFAVSGKACDNTCTGKANLQPNTDPEYKEFKEMYTCIEEKCTIQVGKCENDDTCAVCLSEEKADYCYGSNEFLAVVDCTMCKCTERKESVFCHQKLNPGMAPPRADNNYINGRQPDSSPRSCSPSETMKGSNAVLTFAGCSQFDQVSMLVTSYDENKFGLLDQFEKCAHSFFGSKDRGGHTALGCMQILVNAMSYVEGDANEDDSSGAIAALAGLLYSNADGFCECAAKASGDCPLCSSFIHLKTLLYESLDACQSLDEIDCDAWTEFYKPCKNNFMEKFGSVDFFNNDACKFVHDGCGGAGPFPAFRRLDCRDESETNGAEASWDFYTKYSSACLKYDGNDDGNIKPNTSGTDALVAPTPRPTAGRVATGPKPSSSLQPTLKPSYPSDEADKKPYVPSHDHKQYVPPDDTKQDSKQESSSSSEKTSHPVRNLFIACLLSGVGYYYYNRRIDTFSFFRYRNSRYYSGGESEMFCSAPYRSLTMDSGSGAFQPPSLPLTPSAIDEGSY